MGLSVFPAPSSGTNRYTQVFTSTGTFVAPSTCNSVSLFMVGGGGAGGSAFSSGANINASGGGGGGAVIQRDVAVTPGTSYTVTIGAGGSAVASGSGTGNAGAATTFGALVSAAGGGGGGNCTNGTSNAGGDGACGGGASGASGSPYTQRAGWGGSAGMPIGGFYPGVITNSTTYNPQLSLRGGRGTVHSKGQDSSVGTQASDGQFFMTPGIGVQGFGDGGQGGSVNAPTQASYAYSSGGTSASANGGSGAANTGAGGAGGIGNGGSSVNGGSGGSGYCVVTYWA